MSEYADLVLLVIKKAVRVEVRYEVWEADELDQAWLVFPQSVFVICRTAAP